MTNGMMRVLCVAALAASTGCLGAPVDYEHDGVTAVPEGTQPLEEFGSDAWQSAPRSCRDRLPEDVEFRLVGQSLVVAIGASGAPICTDEVADVEDELASSGRAEESRRLRESSLLAVGLAVVWPDRARITASGQLEVVAALSFLWQSSIWLLAGVAACLALVAGLDFAYQRLEFLKQMRMSRRDIQDEHKQSDGDPMIKQRLRQLRMEKARRRMMAEVPGATVIVTNPTHYSIALRYVAGETPAPKVVAKGTDELALRIRAVARAHDVPVIESPPLARVLYRSVELGALVPPEHYQAVAEIIGHVLRLRPAARDIPDGTG